MMRLVHKTPCAQCPWRRVAPPGWLGGFEPHEYADPVAGNEVPACHQRDFGPDDERTAMCAGALSVMANACLSAWKTPDGDAAKKIVGRRDDTFSHPYAFFEHHSHGQAWQHPLLRRQEVEP